MVIDELEGDEDYEPSEDASSEVDGEETAEWEEDLTQSFDQEYLSRKAALERHRANAHKLPPSGLWARKAAGEHNGIADLLVIN